MMKIAGADFGSTHAKFVWAPDMGDFNGIGQLEARSTLDMDKADLLEEMSQKGITHVYASGIQCDREDENIYALQGMKLIKPNPQLDRVKLEKKLIVEGLLEFNFDLPSSYFLLVSVGTGISYSYSLPGGFVVSLPVGSALGGGFINGLRSLLSLSWEDLEKAEGEPLDLFVRDYLPDHPNKDFVLAHLGKANKVRSKYSKGDLAASILHCVAATLAKDISLLGVATKNVVIVGTPISRLPWLRSMIGDYVANMLGKNLYFGDEWAAAAGAYLTKDPEDHLLF
jgi:pantothenate kinase